jgi:hypothetical protein
MSYPSFRRIYPRYQVEYPVIVGWESCVGEGHLTSLSLSGYSVQCDRVPQVGGAVRVGVLLPDQTQALFIEGGTIKWVAGRQFGVEFVELPLTARLRLHHTLRQALIHRLRSLAAQRDQPVVPA